MKPLPCAEKIGDHWPLNDFLLGWDVRTYRTRNVLGCCMETGFDVTSLFARIQGGEGSGGVFIHLKGDRASSDFFFFSQADQEDTLRHL